MKTVNSTLFESTVHIVSRYERKPDGIWFLDSEVEKMKHWDDDSKKLLFRLKQVFGSETVLEG